MKSGPSPVADCGMSGQLSGKGVDRVRIAMGVIQPFDSRNRGERGKCGQGHPKGSTLRRLAARFARSMLAATGCSLAGLLPVGF